MQHLVKDITSIDIDDILSCWQWLLKDMREVVLITYLGDIFLIGNDNAVYWLQTDAGELTKVAEDLNQFESFLSDEEKTDNWFLPSLVEKLLNAGKILKQNEVYSYNKPPVLGGEYSVENIDPTDMSVHFAVSGQIFEQLKDLPDGTKVNIIYKQN